MTPTRSAIAPDPESREWSGRAVRALKAVAVAGIVLRLIRFFANRSLWLDESYLAESILTRGIRQLTTEPLLHWQAAPVGYLWLEKLAVTCFGSSEHALRIVSLVAGITSVVFVAAIARRCLGAVGGLTALVLFAGVEPLVYYSAEVKQYSSDVAVAVTIVWAAICYVADASSVRRLLVLAAIGGVGIFLSHPAIFVVAGTGVLLFVNFVRERQKAQTLRIAGVGAFWLALFALNYVAFLRPLMHHEGLATYWADAYMPRDRTAVIWLGRSLYRIFTDYSTMWMPLPDIAVVVSLLGCAWLWQRDRRALGLLVSPIVLALLAAALHRFPFSGRLILFLVPMVVLLIGAGAQAVWDATSPGRRMVPVIVLLMLLGPTVGRAVFYGILPPGREELKPLLTHLGEERRPGDVLYVFNISQQPYRYYRDRFGTGPDRFRISDLEWVAGNQIEPTESAFTDELKKLSGKPRVWVLLSHFAALGGPDERQIIPPVLDRMGKRLDDRTATGARLLLYDLTTSTAPASEPMPPR